MGKYHKNKKKSKNTALLKIIFLVLALLLLGLVIWMAVSLGQDDTPGQELPTETTTEPTAAATDSTDTPAQTEQQVIHVQTAQAISLENGLQIERIADYAGIYMEDGSDEIVSGVMMILLKNTSDQDLQLARIEMLYTDFSAEFEVTNLPAGETVVALEKNRHGTPDEEPRDIKVKNVVFFQTPMSLMEDMVTVSGGNGYLDVTNVSGGDIAGEVQIYYKNSAVDLLYGGITYRAVLKEGIAAGETIRVMTGHYSEGNSRIVNVICGE